MGKMMTDKEKEIMAIKMLNEGLTYPQITHACNISPNTLSAIKKKLTGEKPSEPMYTKAYRLFETKQPFQVAVELGITQPEASKYYSEYRILKGLDDLSWLYHTLGYKNISELKSLHTALTQKGVKPLQYATLIRKANKIDNLILEEERLVKQNLKMGAHSFDLGQENDRLICQNEDLKETNEELYAENGQLKYEKKALETAVSKDVAEIKNLGKQKRILIDDICCLGKEYNEKASKIKQLNVALNIWQVNYHSVVRKLIEDIELYVIEAIRESAGMKMGNCTVNELLDEDDYLKILLRHILKMPLSIENIESLINAP
jgi:hypothetical protein